MAAYQRSSIFNNFLDISRIFFAIFAVTLANEFFGTVGEWEGCGQNSLHLAMKTINSDFALPNEFPWMVKLEIGFANQTYRKNCAAVLIATRWLLTSARCVVDQNGKEALKANAYFGEYDKLLHYEANSLAVPVEAVFVQRLTDSGVALLRITIPNEVLAQIHPICLPDEDFCDKGYSHAINATPPVDGCLDGVIAGWDSSKNNYLRKASVAVLPFDSCSQTFAEGNFSSSALCTMSSVGGGVALFGGQIGSPLMCYSGRGVSLLGVLSDFRSDNRTQVTTQLYDRTCTNSQWIDKTVRENSKTSNKPTANKVTTKMANLSENQNSTVGNSSQPRTNSRVSPSVSRTFSRRRCIAQLPIRDVDFNTCYGPHSLLYYYSEVDDACVGFIGCGYSDHYHSEGVCRHQCAITGRNLTTPQTTSQTFIGCLTLPIVGVDYETDSCNRNETSTFYYFSSLRKCTAFSACSAPDAQELRLGKNIFESYGACRSMCWPLVLEEAVAKSNFETSNGSKVTYSISSTNFRSSLTILLYAVVLMLLRK